MWSEAPGQERAAWTPIKPSRIDLRAFFHHLAQQAGEDGDLPLPGLGEEDYAARILKALALRGFLPARAR